MISDNFFIKSAELINKIFFINKCLFLDIFCYQVEFQLFVFRLIKLLSNCESIALFT